MKLVAALLLLVAALPACGDGLPRVAVVIPCVDLTPRECDLDVRWGEKIARAYLDAEIVLESGPATDAEFRDWLAAVRHGRAVWPANEEVAGVLILRFLPQSRTAAVGGDWWLAPASGDWMQSSFHVSDAAPIVSAGDLSRRAVEIGFATYPRAFREFPVGRGSALYGEVMLTGGGPAR